MTNPPESELETYCEWLCIKAHNIHGGWNSLNSMCCIGLTYYFHEDAPPPSDNFQMVVNELDEPITKLTRKA